MTILAGYYALCTAIDQNGTLSEATTYTRPTVTLTGSATTGLTQSLSALTNGGTAPTGPAGKQIIMGAIMDSLTGGNALCYWSWAQPYAVIGTDDFAAVTVNIQFLNNVAQALAFSSVGGEASSGSTIDKGAQIGTMNGNPVIAANKLVILSGNLYVQSLGSASTQQTVPSNVNLVMQGTGSLIRSATTGITAGTTRTQAGATVLTTQFNRVDTVTAPTAGTNASDGVKLMAAAAGLEVTVWNTSAYPIKVYGNGTDTINGMTNTVGVLMHPRTLAVFHADATGTWLAYSESGFRSYYTAMTDTANATITAAALTAGTDLVVVNMTGTLTGAATLTLPTVAQTTAAMHLPIVGKTWVLRVINSGAGAFAWTLTTAAGWTLTAGGTMSVAQGTTKDFLMSLPTITTGTAQNIGMVSTGFVL